MLLNSILNDGANPVLEAMIRFSGARQKLIAHNVANLDTPDFRPLDVSPQEFQRVLASAVDRRRGTGRQEDLKLGDSQEIRQGGDGRIDLTPRSFSQNILFHDRNNRDLERLMQDNAENVAAFRVATDLLKSRMDLLRSAISERV